MSMKTKVKQRHQAIDGFGLNSIKYLYANKGTVKCSKHGVGPDITDIT